MEKKCVFLYSEIMGYNYSIFNELILRGYEIHVVHWNHKKISDINTEKMPGLNLYNRSEFQCADIILLIEQTQPYFIYVSGWMDKEYLKAIRKFKKRFPVISGLDNKWENTIKQHILSLTSKFTIRKYFDFFWVAGIKQKKFAIKLGYTDDRIVSNLYCADINKFKHQDDSNRFVESQDYPKTIYYVGRYADVKGLDFLISIFLKVIADFKINNWKLVLIGNGSIKEDLMKSFSSEYVIFKDFLQPTELVEEIKKAGVFCLPSKKEPWGVVVQEMASAGLPLICSDQIGSAEIFVKNELNGYIFEIDSEKSLYEILKKIFTKLSDSDLRNIGKESIKLSKNITPEKSVDELLKKIAKWYY